MFSVLEVQSRVLKLSNVSMFILVDIFKENMGRKGEMGRYIGLQVGVSGEC
jgi:hypothetical protein